MRTKKNQSITFFILYISIVFFQCDNKQSYIEKKNNINDTLAIKGKFKYNEMDSAMQSWLSIIGYEPTIDLPLKSPNELKAKITLQCGKRLIHKILYLKDNKIDEELFDIMYDKNEYKVKYQNLKKIKDETQYYTNYTKSKNLKFRTVYYDNVKNSKYTDNLIYNFLKVKIFKYSEIPLMDPKGAFRIIIIDYNNKVYHFNLYSYLGNDKEIKQFYVALMKNTKKCKCQCFEKFLND